MAVVAIAGLGNPGSTYAGTRHNIGAEFVQKFAASMGATFRIEKHLDCELAKVQLEGQTIFLIKPRSWMNQSGQALRKLTRFFHIKPTSLAIVYDDINLDLGRLKVSLSGSAGGHNGVTDILQHLGNGFIRFRIGIESKPHPQVILSDWVLGKQTPQEQSIYTTQLNHYFNGLRLLVRDGPEAAMNQLNQKTPPEKLS